MSNSQFGGLFREALGQCGEALVAAAHHGVQAGTLSRTPEHRRAAVLIVTWSRRIDGPGGAQGRKKNEKVMIKNKLKG